MHQSIFSIGPAAQATLVAGFMLLCAPASAPAQTGEEFSSTELSCSGLKLESASGLSGGDERKYRFGGSCRVYQSNGEGQQHDFPVTAEARWSVKTKTLSEQLQILGHFEYYDIQVGGAVASLYWCSADPIVGSAACNGHQHKNDTGLEQFSEPFQAHKPLLAGRTTLAEATKLNSTAGTVPPPPPPAGSQPLVRGTAKPRDEAVVVVPPALPSANVDSADQSKAPRTATRRAEPSAEVPPPPPLARPQPRPGR
jgi:hypothetical protein